MYERTARLYWESTGAEIRGGDTRKGYRGTSSIRNGSTKLFRRAVVFDIEERAADRVSHVSLKTETCQRPFPQELLGSIIFGPQIAHRAYSK